MDPHPEISIAGRRIGRAHEPYVIGEVSANHGGSLDRALALVAAIAEAGADAIKIQTYTADTLTLACDRPEFRIAGGPWHGRTLHALYAQAGTPYEWHAALFAKARSCGIPLFSSPFDESAVDLLRGLDAPAFKIASFEIVDHALIGAAARCGKPLIVSTGLANADEITGAVTMARAQGASEIALLHCVSAYPAPVEDANLRTIPYLADRFGCVAGLSDHTLGATAAVTAVAVGAAIIEKHVTLSRADGGPDAAFSLEPQEFRQLVRDCKAAWRALGSVRRDGPTESERGNLMFRRSLYAVVPIRSGEMLTRDNIRSIRPGHGLPPRHLGEILGRTATRDLGFGEPLDWQAISGSPQP